MLKSSYLIKYQRKEKENGIELPLQNKVTYIRRERSTFWYLIKQNLTWPSYNEGLAYNYFHKEDRLK